MKRYITNYFKKVETDRHETISINDESEHEPAKSELPSSIIGSSQDSTRSIFDVKHIVGKIELTNAEKIDHFKKIWTPGPDFKFPATKFDYHCLWATRNGHKDFGPLNLEEPIKNDGNFQTFLKQYLKAIVDAGTEQFSLCARCYDLEDKKIHETFLKFVPVTDLSGRSLAQIIIDELIQLKINFKFLRGQGYDGAVAMSGKFNGVQACIRESYHSAIYVHCSAHNLNLSISYACSVPSIRNAM